MIGWIVQQVTYVVNNITNVINNTSTTIINAVDDIAAAIAAVKAWVSDQLGGVYSAAVRWARDNLAAMIDVIDYVRGVINDTIAMVNITAWRARETLYLLIRDWALSIFAIAIDVYNAIRSGINDAIAFVNITAWRAREVLYLAITGWVAQHFPTLSDIFDSDVWKTAAALKDFLASILLFFSDPIRTLRDLLMPWVVTWVCRAIAHEIDPSITLFGSVSNPYGGSGGGEVGGTSPNTAGELAWPLDWLTCCGNSFDVPPGHKGQDYVIPANLKVYAMHDGYASVPPFMERGYGNYVIVSGGPWRTLYGHGDRVVVADGAKVKKGQQIMVGDSTGRSTGTHLHLEIIYNGQYLNPVDVLP